MIPALPGAGPTRIEYATARESEVGVIEHVEDFEAKVEGYSLLNACAFHEGGVEDRISRTRHRILSLSFQMYRGLQ